MKYDIQFFIEQELDFWFAALCKTLATRVYIQLPLEWRIIARRRIRLLVLLLFSYKEYGCWKKWKIPFDWTYIILITKKKDKSEHFCSKAVNKEWTKCLSICLTQTSLTCSWTKQKYVKIKITSASSTSTQTSRTCSLDKTKVHRDQKIHFYDTRPKPAYGRQGLDWDRRARIQFGQVHFGAKMSRHQQGDPTDLLWCKNVTLPTGGSSWPPLIQKTWRYQQGDPTDHLWSKNVTVTNRGVQLTF